MSSRVRQLFLSPNDHPNLLFSPFVGFTLLYIPRPSPVHFRYTMLSSLLTLFVFLLSYFGLDFAVAGVPLEAVPVNAER